MKAPQIALLAIALLIPAVVHAQGIDATKLEMVLGRPGQKIGEIVKFGFPRTDLHVSVHGVVVKPGLALGSWAAFSGTDDNARVMGDLVLLQDEVNPVMMRLRSSGFEITAVHNHLLDETPRVMYMHYMGKGRAEDLAKSLKNALSASETPLGRPAPAAKVTSPPAFVEEVEGVLGRKGSFSGGVLAFGIPRRDPVTMGGMTIPPAMGVAEAINFQAAGPSRVATTGDFVLNSEEVNPVISALQDHNILVTALHTHMLDEQPRLFFMHFWAVGSPQSVSNGIKAALQRISIK
ncbi:MAG: DUF1259 domain-containing protein [Acidobacteria bacterium]|nr:MAG: DUF1259 domain-containing protein [Acidobacteriota bacterium]